MSHAKVTVGDSLTGEIGLGLLILLGVTHDDDEPDLIYLVKKIAQMRIFNDADGKMNLSIQDVKGSFLVVSQFTLYADTKKGNRPSYIEAARPELALSLYEYFCKQLAIDSGLSVEKGEFGADMDVKLLNQGPVTIFIDSKTR